MQQHRGITDVVHKNFSGAAVLQARYQIRVYLIHCYSVVKNVVQCRSHDHMNHVHVSVACGCNPTIVDLISTVALSAPKIFLQAKRLDNFQNIFRTHNSNNNSDPN